MKSFDNPSQDTDIEDKAYFNSVDDGASYYASPMRHLTNDDFNNEGPVIQTQESGTGLHGGNSNRRREKRQGSQSISHSISDRRSTRWWPDSRQSTKESRSKRGSRSSRDNRESRSSRDNRESRSSRGNRASAGRQGNQKNQSSKIGQEAQKSVQDDNHERRHNVQGLFDEAEPDSGFSGSSHTAIKDKQISAAADKSPGQGESSEIDKAKFSPEQSSKKDTFRLLGQPDVGRTPKRKVKKSISEDSVVQLEEKRRNQIDTPKSTTKLAGVVQESKDDFRNVSLVLKVEKNESVGGMNLTLCVSCLENCKKPSIENLVGDEESNCKRTVDGTKTDNGDLTLRSGGGSAQRTVFLENIIMMNETFKGKFFELRCSVPIGNSNGPPINLEFNCEDDTYNGAKSRRTHPGITLPSSCSQCPTGVHNVFADTSFMQPWLQNSCLLTEAEPASRGGYSTKLDHDGLKKLNRSSVGWGVTSQPETVRFPEADCVCMQRADNLPPTYLSPFYPSQMPTTFPSGTTMPSTQAFRNSFSARNSRDNLASENFTGNSFRLPSTGFSQNAFSTWNRRGKFASGGCAKNAPGAPLTGFSGSAFSAWKDTLGNLAPKKIAESAYKGKLEASSLQNVFSAGRSGIDSLKSRKFTGKAFGGRSTPPRDASLASKSTLRELASGRFLNKDIAKPSTSLSRIARSAWKDNPDSLRSRRFMGKPLAPLSRKTSGKIKLAARRFAKGDPERLWTPCSRNVFSAWKGPQGTLASERYTRRTLGRDSTRFAPSQTRPLTKKDLWNDIASETYAQQALNEGPSLQAVSETSFSMGPGFWDDIASKRYARTLSRDSVTLDEGHFSPGRDLRNDIASERYIRRNLSGRYSQFSPNTRSAGLDVRTSRIPAKYARGTLNRDLIRYLPGAFSRFTHACLSGIPLLSRGMPLDHISRFCQFKRYRDPQTRNLRLRHHMSPLNPTLH